MLYEAYAHAIVFGNLSLRKTLKPTRPFKYQAYDPNIEPYTDSPVPAELVTVINVLEYTAVEKTLDELEDLVEFTLFCVVNVNNAQTKQPPEWWLPKFWDRFTLQTFQVLDKDQFMVIANNINIPM